MQRSLTIKERIITALIALPLLIAFIYFANTFVFSVFILAVSSLGLNEFYRLALPSELWVERKVATLSGSALVAVIAFGGPTLALPALVALFLFIALFYLFRFDDISRVAGHLALTCAGFFYVSLLIVHVALLRNIEFGRGWIFFVLLAIMACDSAAYFTGSSLGRRKLYPAVSPKKSVEGALGGVAGSVVAALVVKFWFFPALGLVDCFVLGVLLAIVGQLGDLFESLLKRSFDVKDSGSLIPGHGGILDRLDSLLFAFPLAYYYARFFFHA